MTSEHDIKEDLREFIGKILNEGNMRDHMKFTRGCKIAQPVCVDFYMCCSKWQFVIELIYIIYVDYIVK